MGGQCTSRRSDPAAIAGMPGSARGPPWRRAGTSIGPQLWKDATRDQHATATRMLGGSALFRHQLRRPNGETELECLGLADIKVASDAELQRRAAVGCQEEKHRKA